MPFWCLEIDKKTKKIVRISTLVSKKSIAGHTLKLDWALSTAVVVKHDNVMLCFLSLKQILNCRIKNTLSLT